VVGGVGCSDSPRCGATAGSEDALGALLPGVGEGEVMGIVRGRLVMPPEINTHARVAE
jgi:hypothetical protein